MNETQHVELKSSWRDEYLKWIAGFANAEGGVLVIGKDDDGRIVGVPDARRLLVDIPNKVVSHLGIVVAVNLKGRGDKHYLEIHVDPHPFPVSYKGEYHVRSGSTKQELKGAALDRFLLSRQGRRWDGVPVPGVTIGDLDGASVRAFREEARVSKRLPASLLRATTTSLLGKLHLIVRDDKPHLLKRAAVLLFHPDPERYVTGAYVKVGFFQREGGLVYQDEVHGSLFSQLSGAMDLLLTKYLRAMVSYSGLQRVETFPVPEDALREALTNAIAHKDYSSGAPVQVRVYEGMISVANSAHLPDGWTVETLRGPHLSEPPNPDIANAFFRAGMIESWGQGMEMMSRRCIAHGISAPRLSFDGSGLRLEFHFPRSAGTPVETPGKTPLKTLVQTPLKTLVQTRVNAARRTQDHVLALLAKEPSLTLREVAAHLGKSVSAVARAVAKLTASGRLRRVGPDKSGRWEVIE